MSIKRLKNFIVQKISAEIPDSLTYHGVHHTLGVVDACSQYIRRLKIPPHDAKLLRTAALMHDIGIMWDYFNHEDKSMAFVKETLPAYSYSKTDIERICGMIRATRIPQKPQNLLEQIIGDADLDYLGTDQFYFIGDTLFREFLVYNVVKNEEDWDKLQIKFLKGHTYHTDFAKKHRAPRKKQYIKDLLNKWNWKESDFES